MYGTFNIMCEIYFAVYLPVLPTLLLLLWFYKLLHIHKAKLIK